MAIYREFKSLPKQQPLEGFFIAERVAGILPASVWVRDHAKVLTLSGKARILIVFIL
jgi:hypothetical protein